MWEDNRELSDGFLWISRKLRCSSTVTAGPRTLLRARALRHITEDEPHRAELMGYSEQTRHSHKTGEGTQKLDTALSC